MRKDKCSEDHYVNGPKFIELTEADQTGEGDGHYFGIFAEPPDQGRGPFLAKNFILQSGLPFADSFRVEKGPLLP